MCTDGLDFLLTLWTGAAQATPCGYPEAIAFQEVRDCLIPIFPFPWQPFPVILIELKL